MTSENIEFGDSDAEDAYDPEDKNISWDNVDELAAEYERINAIEDDEERLAEAKKLMAELSRGV